MNHSIRTKLIFSYLAIALLTALLIYALIRITSGTRLKSLIVEQEIAKIQEEIAIWYIAEGNLNEFGTYYRTLHPPPPPPPQGGNGGKRRPPEGAHGVIDLNNRVIVPLPGFRRQEIIPADRLKTAVPVLVNNQTVAYIIPDNTADVRLADEEQSYLRRTNQVLLIAGLIGIGAALLMGFGLARPLIRPIHDLTRASKAMASGDLEQQVPIRSADELGQLATTFNKMSHDLAEATRQRRQMTADIAHDLSTPIQVISGYIEAFQDESLSPTPARINTIAAEIDQLRHLVTDLDLLAQTDTHTLRLNIQPINTAGFLQQIVESFTPLASAESIQLQAEIQPNLPPIQADHERLMQVMGNLLSNSLRYTPAGGSIIIGARAEDESVILQVKDNGRGIHHEDLPHIFDRFYRGDPSRTASGKMGLGLAISKALVKAMGGTISVQSNEHTQGTTFFITLNISQ